MLYECCRTRLGGIWETRSKADCALDMARVFGMAYRILVRVLGLRRGYAISDRRLHLFGERRMRTIGRKSEIGLTSSQHTARLTAVYPLGSLEAHSIKRKVSHIVGHEHVVFISACQEQIA